MTYVSQEEKSATVSLHSKRQSKWQITITVFPCIHLTRSLEPKDFDMTPGVLSGKHGGLASAFFNAILVLGVTVALALRTATG